MSFTEEDLANAGKFANVNYKIRLLQVMKTKAPHLTTHLLLDYRDATDADYHRPAALMEKCKVLDIRIGKDLCTLLSCNPSKEKSPCTPDDVASYYYLGDNQLDVQCQPACFNTIPVTAETTTSKNTITTTAPQPHTYMLNHFQDECRIVPESIVRYLEKTYYRSPVHYEKRVNDMPTGFSRTVSSNIYGSGYGYTTNAAYCDYFNLKKLNNGECGQKWWQVGLHYTIGLNLVNDLQSAYRTVFNHGVEFSLPKNLPKKPDTLPSILTVDGWRKNINKNFVIPEIIEPKQHDIKDEHVQNDRNRRERDIQQSQQRQQRTPKQIRNIRDSDWQTQMETIINEYLHNLSITKKLLIAGTVIYLETKTLRGIQALALKLIESLSPIIGREALAVEEIIGSRVLAAALRGTCVEMATRFSLGIGSRSAIYLARTLSVAANVTSTFLLVAQIFDFALSFWDPFGYNNISPTGYAQAVMDMGERYQRQQSDRPTQVYDFDALVTTLLTPEEISNIGVQTFVDRLAYLNALSVNSNGVVIDKGDLIDMNKINESVPLSTQTSALQQMYARALVKHFHFNVEEYEDFNRNFMLKAKLHDKIVDYACMTGVGSIVCVVIGLPILSVFLVIITLMLFAVARFELSTSFITHARNELKLNSTNII